MPGRNMRNSAMPQDAQLALEFLDTYVAHAHPGCSYDIPAFGLPGTDRG